MSKPASAAEYRSKAERALASARTLLASADPDGACNRAYYAMFDAAHVALFEAGFGEAAVRIKTHRGLLTLFGRELIRTGRIPVELGRTLDQVEQLRLASDYLGGTSTPAEAAWAVERADAFLRAVAAMLPKP